MRARRDGFNFKFDAPDLRDYRGIVAAQGVCEYSHNAEGVLRRHIRAAVGCAGRAGSVEVGIGDGVAVA